VDSWVSGRSPSQPNISFEQLKIPLYWLAFPHPKQVKVRNARERAAHCSKNMPPPPMSALHIA
jgi:hypothetical protein